MAASNRKTPVSKSPFLATSLKIEFDGNFPGYLFSRTPLSFYKTSATLQVSDNPAEKKYIFRSSFPVVFCKKVALKIFANFTGRHLCQSLF